MDNLTSQALVVKTARESALTARVEYLTEELNLKKEKGLRAITIKDSNPKATVQVIEATLGQEFEDKDKALLTKEEAWKRLEIEAEYQDDILTILKLTYKPA